jgi:spore coat polysaccharide biosynthesis protein SpsF
MIGCIIQARMGSTRLPGKVLKLLDGKNPSLFYTINQLKKCKKIDLIIVATTTLEEDDVLEKYVNNLSILCFRGKSDDVLDRYYNCAKKFSLNKIVRITADCPLIDPEVVDKVVDASKNNSFDYITNFFPRTFPDGVDVEIMSFDALENAWKKAKLPSEREHVTPYLYNHKNDFKIKNIKNDEDLSHFRLTLDYNDDLELIIKIISKIKKRPILIRDIIKLFRKEPKLIEINSKHVPNEGFDQSLENDKKL